MLNYQRVTGYKLKPKLLMNFMSTMMTEIRRDAGNDTDEQIAQLVS